MAARMMEYEIFEHILSDLSFNAEMSLDFLEATIYEVI